ncbi:dihydrodipicolinate synthase family protein [Pelagicoccus enzymogenes]|uniref:dihydrodipicolinate synthase family protein n=1 Tax=Pelagicoccus enzymogenes TaxID=2773457 RepID=UPI00280CFFFF|nr:dihydrodipicolinate synthase family protein [Pelagicoccus enzymogenes]MDQ8198017.1 dihydrodipicolinate synthase family protein [Pelagicoccus enzymogenes]
MSSTKALRSVTRERLMDGVVIPAHPLALDSSRKLDERRQVALTRYYCESGAGGIAVGVHTTQFEIRETKYGLYQPVLELAAKTMDACEAERDRGLIRVAGIAGKTHQAVAEAEMAAELGYHLGLVSLAALSDASNEERITHMRAIAEVFPVFGFYLQPSVGGCRLDFEFWREVVEIENLIGIKMAPFNRYETLNVLRAVYESGRAGEIALYTGNDDNILVDLASEFRFSEEAEPLRIRGGLLGQWAVWTHQAVKDLQAVKAERRSGLSKELLTRAHQLTDANAAIFDVANGFAGCIPGIHEILRRQGLLEGRWCLDPQEELSLGQMEELDRIHAAYPSLNDDKFVRENLDRWLS